VTAASEEPELPISPSELLPPPAGSTVPPPPDPGTLALQILAQINVNSTIIPPAHAIAPWEALVPGAAKQFLDQALSQSEHRQSLERKALDYDHKRGMAGINAGKWVVLGAFLLAGLAVWRNQPLVAGAISVSGLASLAAVFVIGKKTTGTEMLRKMLAMGRAARGQETQDS
jgi:uncharacterized membrane protein